MRKILMGLLCLVLCVSVAAAECCCVVPPALVYIAEHLVDMQLDMSAEDLNAIAAVALGNGQWAGCKKTKRALLNALVMNWDMVLLNTSKAQRDVVMDYITACGCEDEAAVEVQAKPQQVPVVVPKHEHAAEEYESLNSTYHRAVCGCGYAFGQEAHHLGAVLRVENGMAVKRCAVCGWLVYVWSGADCGCAECAGCCDGCGCGCCD